MNTRTYPTLHLDIKKSKGTALLLLLYISYSQQGFEKNGLWCFTPLSTIFLLYRGGLLYC